MYNLVELFASSNFFANHTLLTAIRKRVPRVQAENFDAFPKYLYIKISILFRISNKVLMPCIKEYHLTGLTLSSS